MNEPGLTGFLSVVFAGLSVAAIVGSVFMYRQVGELNRAIVFLTDTIENLGKTQRDERQEAREDRLAIHRRIDALVVSKRVGRGVEI